MGLMLRSIVVKFFPGSLGNPTDLRLRSTIAVPYIGHTLQAFSQCLIYPNFYTKITTFFSFIFPPKSPVRPVKSHEMALLNNKITYWISSPIYWWEICNISSMENRDINHGISFVCVWEREGDCLGLTPSAAKWAHHSGGQYNMINDGPPGLSTLFFRLHSTI